MSYLTAIAKARHAILADNEEPRDLLISSALKHAVMAEVTPYLPYRFEAEADRLFGMKIEWIKPVPLTQPQISIRTTKGDKRVVTMLGMNNGESSK